MSALTRVFMQGGLLMWPLVLILLVVLGIALGTAWRILVRGGTDRIAVQQGLDGLLFWGGFAVVIGVLGSAIGYHKSISTVAKHGLANWRAVWIGSAEAMVTTIAGLAIIVVAGACWYALRWKFLEKPPTTIPPRHRALIVGPSTSRGKGKDDPATDATKRYGWVGVKEPPAL